MKAGNHNLPILILIFILITNYAFSEQKINLKDLQPTFEEESETVENNILEDNTIKSKVKKKNNSGITIVKFRALDKITAKTSDLDIPLGNKKRFGYLEILPKNCKKSTGGSELGFVAYIQVKDLSDKKDEKVFVFNGWTFSSSPTLRPFDHPIYDLWITGCENI